MKNQIYVIDPVVYVDSNGTIQPVDGIFGSIISGISKVGSGIVKGVGSVASKLGTVIKSPVVSKLLEGGLALGGSVLLAKQAQKQQDAQLKAQQQADAQAMAAMQAQARTGTSSDPSGTNTKTILLYGGAAVLALAAVYMLSRRRR
jgi:hypothetical protein